jgi:hypothetical protein
MSRKRPYKKPFVASNKVFTLTSQACDVEYILPGPCEDMMWMGCGDFQRKSPTSDTCLIPPIKPIFKS